jgi:hypothetical protein
MSRRTGTTPTERKNREARRDAIIRCIDFGRALSSLPLFGQDLVDMLEAAPEAFWERVKAQLGGDVPSPETRRAVVDVYAYRTEGDRLAREYLARTLGQVAA